MSRQEVKAVKLAASAERMLRKKYMGDYSAASVETSATMRRLPATVRR